MSSPLTNDHYCETPEGCSYGTAKTPWQLGPFSFAIESSVPGLYSCGASTISHGVAGAAMSGLIAAQKVVGAATSEELLAPADGTLRVYPAERPETWLDDRVTQRGGEPAAISPVI